MPQRSRCFHSLRNRLRLMSFKKIRCLVALSELLITQSMDLLTPDRVLKNRVRISVTAIGIGRLICKTDGDGC